MCGDTGVNSIARCFGDTTGPRADSEYAVEPGRRGHDQSVGRVVGERLAVDARQQPHRVPRCSLLHDGFVQGASHEDAVHRHVEHHAPVELPSARFRTGHEPVECLAEPIGLDLREVAERAEVDAEDRHRRSLEQSHGAQHRAVATEAEHQVGLGDRANARDSHRDRAPRRRRRASRT
jgi:hypothetical protein